MALKVIEFFGYAPLDPTAANLVAQRRCPFVESNCIKPDHGTCAVQQLRDASPVICCPNRLYASTFRILSDVASEAFGPNTELVKPPEVLERRRKSMITGN